MIRISSFASVLWISSSLSVIGCGGSEDTGGGQSATGGVKSTAGSSATGGNKAAGGASATGGVAQLGGASATGGSPNATGGTSVVAGGASTTGGAAAGGTTSTGGDTSIGGGTSAIQQVCNTDCAITEALPAVATCLIPDCPNNCVKYYDVLAAVDTKCSDAFLSVLTCGSNDTTGWTCLSSSGVTLPVPFTSCASLILALGAQLQANGSACANALSAAQ